MIEGPADHVDHQGEDETFSPFMAMAKPIPDSVSVSS